jgi:hypothetical protein
MFDIVTLSDRNYSRLADPVTIITGGIGLLQSLFPNIFGGARHRLTDSDWLQLIPGNGIVTNALRNYLKTRIHYSEDLQKIDPGSGFPNLEAFTRYYAGHFVNTWCPDGSCQGNPPEVLMPKFYDILRRESIGQSPIGTIPGFFPGGSTDWGTVAIIGGLVVLFLALNKGKKK